MTPKTVRLYLGSYLQALVQTLPVCVHKARSFRRLDAANGNIVAENQCVADPKVKGQATSGVVTKELRVTRRTYIHYQLSPLPQ